MWLLWHQLSLVKSYIQQIINEWVKARLYWEQKHLLQSSYNVYSSSESTQSLSSTMFCNNFVKCPQTQALLCSWGCGEFKKASRCCQLKPQWWCGLRHKHAEERLAAFFLLQTQSGSLYNPTTRNHGQTVIHDSATGCSIRCCKVAPCWFMQGDCRVKPLFVLCNWQRLNAVEVPLINPPFAALLNTDLNMSRTKT